MSQLEREFIPSQVETGQQIASVDKTRSFIHQNKLKLLTAVGAVGLVLAAACSESEEESQFTLPQAPNGANCEQVMQHFRSLTAEDKPYIEVDGGYIDTGPVSFNNTNLGIYIPNNGRDGFFSAQEEIEAEILNVISTASISFDELRRVYSPGELVDGVVQGVNFDPDLIIEKGPDEGCVEIRE